MSERVSLLGSGAVADQLGLPRWKFLYLVDRGDLPDASLQVAGRRLFTPEDVVAIKVVLEALEAQESEEVAKTMSA